MLSTETLQGIYDNNCEYLTSLNRENLINMCQILASTTLAINISEEDVDDFSNNYNFSMKEKNNKTIEVIWEWNKLIKVTINPVNITVDYNRRGGWNRESIFSTSFLYCFN